MNNGASLIYWCKFGFDSPDVIKISLSQFSSPCRMRAPLALLLSFLSLLFLASQAEFMLDNFLVVGHRGAPSYRPEETLASYDVAHFQEASFLETDLCVTQDSYLICRHDCDLGITTDIASHPEFASRATQHGDTEEWFSGDFTLEEIRTLRAKERLPEDVRTHNFDGLYQVITVDEFLQFVNALNLENTTSPDAIPENSVEGPKYGVYIETKEPSRFRSLGYDMESLLRDALERWGYVESCTAAKTKSSTNNEWISRCGAILQSFELNLQEQFPEDCQFPRVQLIEDDPSMEIPDSGLTYGDLMTLQGLSDISIWGQGIGPSKTSVIDYNTLNSTGLLENAHSVGLLVHPYTFRPEDYYQNAAFNNSFDDEFHAFMELGVDGVFTDSPEAAWGAVESFYPAAIAPEQSPEDWADWITIGFYVLTGLTVCLFVTLMLTVAYIFATKKKIDANYEIDMYGNDV